jgi:hypothetical protein
MDELTRREKTLWNVNKYSTTWEGTHDPTSSVNEFDEVTVVEGTGLS